MDEVKKTASQEKIIIVVLVGLMVIILAILLSILLNLSLVANLVMGWILTTLYALFAFFMVDPVVKITPVKIIEKPIYKEIVKVVEKPIIKEIQVPIENKVIEVVEKQVPVEVYKTNFEPRKRLNIPKFEFIGSTQTRTYHKRTCKFSKMLKNKFKLHSNSKAFFKRKHYKACKTCLKIKPKKPRKSK